jgi:hypothetical protein
MALVAWMCQDRSSRTVQMYSAMYGRIKGWDDRTDAHLPPAPNPYGTLPRTVLYICEHFANFFFCSQTIGAYRLWQGAKMPRTPVLGRFPAE